MLNFMSKYFSNLRHIELVNVRLDTLHIYLFVTRMSGTKLKSLVLDRNLISKINFGIYKGFRSLEVVSMSYNQMSSPIDLIAELLELPNLRYLNLSRQNQIIPKSPNRVRREEHHDYVYHACIRSLGYTCTIRFPKNLTHLDLSYSGFQLPAIPQIAMMNNNSLQFVYFVAR